LHNGRSKARGDANRNPSNHTAHGYIPEHARLAILWGEIKDNHQRGGDEDRDVSEEARSQEELLEFGDLTNGFFLGS